MSEKIHGLLLVNKPSGITSHDVVGKLRKILNTKTIGHAGTLDPMASGLMALLIGEATKLSQYILEGDKSYIAKAKLGVITDTLDTTGVVLASQPVSIGPQTLQKACESLVGEFNWEVPIYSAVKVQGKKLYEYARNDQPVQKPVKKMTFYRVAVLSVGEDWVEISMDCSKGSYVRSWVSELGVRLNCGAAMSSLIRTASAPYILEHATTLEDLASSPAKVMESLAFIPINMMLPESKSIRVQGLDQSLILNGQISNSLKSQIISLFSPQEDKIIKILAKDSNQLLAIVGLEEGAGFVIRRVFRY